MRIWMSRYPHPSFTLSHTYPININDVESSFKIKIDAKRYKASEISRFQLSSLIVVEPLLNKCWSHNSRTVRN